MSDAEFPANMPAFIGPSVMVATIPTHSVVVGFGQGVVFVARTNPDDDLGYLERHLVR